MELLRTPRLALRRWREEDAPAFFDIYSRDEVTRWLGPKPRRSVTTLEAARDRLCRGNELVAGMAPPLGLWAIVPLDGEPGGPIGTVLLMPLADSDGPTDLVEIGWHLRPDSQGHGYATEAAQAVLDAAASAGIENVLALIDLDNEPSQRVALRLGMLDEGATDRWFGITLRQYRAKT
ncbi:MAG TPA: GNAT family N-acetyltransferase [Solirubrobacteraceae bacterium]|nr:GNAT family N-acetyltransferase [Solirubrobacteraceae bacterium]